MPDKTPSQRGKSSKRKGKAYEQYIARWYREHGHDAKRGFQTRGGTEQSDVVVDGLSVECKCGARQMNIPDAMAQAIECANPGAMPVVHFRVDRLGDYVVVRLSDWADIMEGKP